MRTNTHTHITPRRTRMTLRCFERCIESADAGAMARFVYVYVYISLCMCMYMLMSMYVKCVCVYEWVCPYSRTNQYTSIQSYRHTKQAYNGTKCIGQERVYTRVHVDIYVKTVIHACTQIRA